MSDQYGRLAALRPANTVETQLYAAEAGKQVQGIVSVCNQTAEISTFSLAHCAAGHGDTAANPEDWREYDTELPPGDPSPEYSFNLAAGESIRVKAGQADAVSFILQGLTMTEV